MKPLQVFLSVLILCFAALHTYAQEGNPVQFKYDKVQKDGAVTLSLKALIKPGVKLYSIQKTSEDAPYSSISFDSAATKYLQDSVEEKGKAQTETDTTFHTLVKYYTDSVTWMQKVNAADSTVLKGTISYMYKRGDEYVPQEEPFKFYIKPPTTKAIISAPAEATNIKHSLWIIFFSAFGSGLVTYLRLVSSP